MRAGARDVRLGPRPLLQVQDPDFIAPVRQEHSREETSRELQRVQRWLGVSGACAQGENLHHFHTNSLQR